MLALHLLVAPDPLAGVGRPLLAAALLLALYALLALGSAAWSDAPARALIEFDRALLYLLALLAAGAAAAHPGGGRVVLYGLAAGAALVCLAGLAEEALPGAWLASGPASDGHGLSYPLTYHNALGLMAAVALVLSLHLATCREEPRAVRLASAVAAPLLLVALVLTESRGAAAAGLVAFAAYLVLVRGGGPLRRRGTVLAGAAAVAAIAVALLAIDLGGSDDAGGDRESSAVGRAEARVDELTEVGEGGRPDHWGVAVEAFADAPLAGHGAGTYELLWDERRPNEVNVLDAHSLYLEALGELGLLGILLIGGAVGIPVVALLRSARAGPDRRLHAALFAITLAWALHAAIDWDWEMPAASLPFFAAAGVGLASPGRGGEPDTRPDPELAGRRGRVRTPGTTVRVAVALGLAVLAVAPAMVALSQPHVDHAVSALGGDRCEEASDAAAAAIDVLGQRPEPYEALAYCSIDRPLVARAAMEDAVDRDPGNWRYRYGLALVLASGGADPRPAARAALERNPRNPLAREAVTRLSGSDPKRWRRAAKRILRAGSAPG